MVKEKVDINNTLLKKKVILSKKPKNTEDIQKAVKAHHENDKKKKENEVIHRATIHLPKEDYIKIKTWCSSNQRSIKDYVSKAILERAKQDKII